MVTRKCCTRKSGNRFIRILRLQSRTFQLTTSTGTWSTTCQRKPLIALWHLECSKWISKVAITCSIICWRRRLRKTERRKFWNKRKSSIGTNWFITITKLWRLKKSWASRSLHQVGKIKLDRLQDSIVMALASHLMILRWPSMKQTNFLELETSLNQVNWRSNPTSLEPLG